MKAWKEVLEESIRTGDLTGSLNYIDRGLPWIENLSVDQFAALLVIRGQLLRELGQHADAAITFRRAGHHSGAKSNTRLYALFQGAREFVELKEYSEAIEMLGLALKEVEGQGSEHSDHQEVEGLARESILGDSGFDPSGPANEIIGRVLLLRAQAARLSQNRDLALQDISSIVNSHRTSGSLRAAARLDRGTIRFENGEPAKAIEDFIVILTMDGSLERHKCDANYNLSLIFASKGDYRGLVRSISDFLRSPLPPVQMKKTLAESIGEILAEVGTDEALAVKEIIASFMQFPA